MFVYFQSLTLKEKVTTLKFKEKSSEEGPSYRNLLLWMVRLIHADPMLMLNVSVCFGCLVCRVEKENLFWVFLVQSRERTSAWARERESGCRGLGAIGLRPHAVCR